MLGTVTANTKELGNRHLELPQIFATPIKTVQVYQCLYCTLAKSGFAPIFSAALSTIDPIVIE